MMEEAQGNLYLAGGRVEDLRSVMYVGGVGCRGGGSGGRSGRRRTDSENVQVLLKRKEGEEKEKKKREREGERVNTSIRPPDT